MHLNPLSLGYQNMAEIGIMTDLAEKETVVKMLSSEKSIILTVTFLGKYSIYGILLARKIDELMQLVTKVDIKRYVNSLDVLILADLAHSQWHPENLALTPPEDEDLSKTLKTSAAKFENVHLDETDKRIAKMLNENSRVPFSAIAKKTKTPIKSVYQRYKNLREKNVLYLSTIAVNPSTLGFAAILDTFINVMNREVLLEVEKQLLQIPNLTFCAKYVGGPYDLRAATLISNFSEIFNLQEKINSIKNIKKTEHYLHQIGKRWIMDTMSSHLLGF